MTSSGGESARFRTGRSGVRIPRRPATGGNPPVIVNSDSLTLGTYTVPRHARGDARLMIRSLSIKGYRGLSRFEMDELACVNLLVGRNNSGKTSVLEALYLLASGGDPVALWRIVNRRGERVDIEPNPRAGPEPEMDITHLFHGHQGAAGASFALTTKNGSPPRSLTYTIREMRGEDSSGQERGEPPVSRTALVVTGTPSPLVGPLPLTRLGGLRGDFLDATRRPRRSQTDRIRPAQFITTESLSPEELANMWNDIVLTEAEDRVLQALRFIEDKIERVAAIVTRQPYFYYAPGARGGFRVKLSDSPIPIPIGSLGDGIWRMLAMAIALVRAKGGVLLVDEIDTGLHYTVLADMWRLIFRTAQEFDIQVFATTHSFDCVHSLATICQSEGPNHVTIQRVEAAQEVAVRYTERQIKIAADRQIEVR